MHSLEEKIRTTQSRFALIPYITAGFPTRATFWQQVEELDAHGADIIEIGVPFSDPVADGPVVEDAARRALAEGMSLELLLSELDARKHSLRAGLVLMGYMNPFLQYGLERFARDAAAAGVQGCIVPDLPYEEAEAFRLALRAQGIALITLVGQNTSEERMRLYATVSEGYVYVVSVMGTTGGKGSLPAAAAETLARARKVFTVPLALGFGLEKASQVAALPVLPDAVVFGSALLRHIDAGNSAASFMQNFVNN